jgi:hypothetical protein
VRRKIKLVGNVEGAF